MRTTQTDEQVQRPDLDEFLDHLDADDAAAVLWHFGGRGGRQPGQFVGHLLRTFSHADPGNRALLAQVFPGLAWAFQIAAQEPFGLDLLAQVAEGGA